MKFLNLVIALKTIALPRDQPCIHHDRICGKVRNISHQRVRRYYWDLKASSPVDMSENTLFCRPVGAKLPQKRNFTHGPEMPFW